MQKTFHILNGDSLLERFPKSINGEKIVFRECFVDGNIKGETLEELYKNRAKFLNENYGEVTEASYNSKTVSQFEMIQKLPEKSNVFLWFEDDVFCQVNFWFAVSLLHESETNPNNIFLIRPQEHSPYSFSHHSNEQLLEIYNNPLNITHHIANIAQLWMLYRNSELKSLHKESLKLKTKYPFIFKATEALIESFPTKSSLGRPKEALIELKRELNTGNFGTLYSAFSEREAIYGFGDLQVLRLLKEIE
ncbi:MAG: DUF1835 domain-containing protein [Patiriisocius sp.]|uniref:DUF1835 domain-containing protein n=1 Tax=Patiriisocius sp. TaxID=2822396 RepID=UPI003EF260BB